ncbi:MAG: alpha/beta hydrolase [Myxococcota bacterium]
MFDTGTRTFLDALARAGTPALHTLPASAARTVYAELQSRGAPRPAADVTDVELPVGPRGRVRARVVRPRGGGVLPAAVYFHGGGWVLGDCDTHDRLVREIAVGAGIAVVSVEYSRAPEARFPVAIDEAFAATRHVAEHGDRLGVDGRRLAVMGDDAGGNLAAVVCLLAKQRGGPRVALQVLFSPIADAHLERPSHVDFADGPWLTQAALRKAWDTYCPDASLRAHPIASPLRASLGQLEGLPPALVVTAENDPLRDEGEAYANWLAGAGVPVTSVRCNGAIHDFVVLDALRDTPGARTAIRQATAALREALQPARVLEPA